MCEIELLVEQTGKIFIKRFDDLHQARVFLLKCKHSRRVGVLSVVCDTYTHYLYVCRGY